MTTKDVIDAWAKIRQIDQTIPDEVLDFMRDAAIQILNKPSLAFHDDMIVTLEHIGKCGSIKKAEAISKSVLGLIANTKEESQSL